MPILFPFGFDLWKMRNGMWLIIGAALLIAVGMSVVVYFSIQANKFKEQLKPFYPLAYPPPPEPPQAQASICPSCGKPLQWISQYQRYYCAAEQKYI